MYHLFLQQDLALFKDTDEEFEQFMDSDNFNDYRGDGRYLKSL